MFHVLVLVTTDYKSDSDDSLSGGAIFGIVVFVIVGVTVTAIVVAYAVYKWCMNPPAGECYSYSFLRNSIISTRKHVLLQSCIT